MTGGSSAFPVWKRAMDILLSSPEPVRAKTAGCPSRVSILEMQNSHPSWCVSLCGFFQFFRVVHISFIDVPDQPSGNTCNDRIRRYVFCDDAAGANDCVFSDDHIAHDDASASDGGAALDECFL